MQDTPLSIINYDQDYNTRLRVGHQDFVSDINPQQNYPKQIQFCDFLNKKVGYFNTSGLSLLELMEIIIILVHILHKQETVYYYAVIKQWLMQEEI